ncbi:unnamed protein product [Phaedon cochleariae]|uniref:HAUS augmin-like complex subunit 3 N-terminal domain-containing protein n=1 Tax=Phaedon cochleariae TaxID=80249 RepID=A0A9P0DMA9_PHACE|nr:unnamed protein product [Phaedon cochleariae]
MEDFNGDDILKVFSELDVKLLNLHPNVIRGWFDTDDENMKNLLSWMCLSLSKENYLSPLETSEFTHIQLPFSMSDLEQEKYEIEQTKFPGIFDVDSNMLEIAFLEDEINILIQEDKQLEELNRINRKQEKDLLEIMDKKISLEIKTSLQLKSAQENCLDQGEKLDKLNKKIHERLLKYGQNLHDFEFSPSPNFINNMDITVNYEHMDNTTNLLMPHLEDSVVPTNNTGTLNITHLNVTNINETIANDFCNLRHRILHSHKRYLVTKIEVDKLKEMLNFLDAVTVETLFSVDSLYLEHNIEAKEESKKRMCTMLDDIATKFADQQIFLTQMKYVEQEIETHEKRLNRLSEIDDAILKLLSHYLVLKILYTGEKKQIDGSYSFFRKVIHYISKDLENCKSRTVKMHNIIRDYEKSTPEDRFKLTKYVIKMLAANEENFTIARAFEIFADFKREIGVLENNLFSFRFSDHCSLEEKWRKSMGVLQKMLISGPTHRIVLIAPELQSVMRKLEEVFRQQQSSVKSAVEISSGMKKIPNKWQNYRRQLWMYFMADSQKLKFILQQIQEHFSNSKLGKT